MTKHDVLPNPKSTANITHLFLLSRIHNISAETGVFDRNNVSLGFYCNVKKFSNLSRVPVR